MSDPRNNIPSTSQLEGAVVGASAVLAVGAAVKAKGFWDQYTYDRSPGGKLSFFLDDATRYMKGAKQQDVFTRLLGYSHALESKEQQAVCLAMQRDFKSSNIRDLFKSAIPELMAAVSQLTSYAESKKKGASPEKKKENFEVRSQIILFFLETCMAISNKHAQNYDQSIKDIDGLIIFLNCVMSCKESAPSVFVTSSGKRFRDVIPLAKQYLFQAKNSIRAKQLMQTASERLTAIKSNIDSVGNGLQSCIDGIFLDKEDLPASLNYELMQPRTFITASLHQVVGLSNIPMNTSGPGIEKIQLWLDTLRLTKLRKMTSDSKSIIHDSSEFITRAALLTLSDNGCVSGSKDKKIEIESGFAKDMYSSITTQERTACFQMYIKILRLMQAQQTISQLYAELINAANQYGDVGASIVLSELSTVVGEINKSILTHVTSLEEDLRNIERIINKVSVKDTDRLNKFLKTEETVNNLKESVSHINTQIAEAKVHSDQIVEEIRAKKGTLTHQIKQIVSFIATAFKNPVITSLLGTDQAAKLSGSLTGIATKAKTKAEVMDAAAHQVARDEYKKEEKREKKREERREGEREEKREGRERKQFSQHQTSAISFATSPHGNGSLPRLPSPVSSVSSVSLVYESESDFEPGSDTEVPETPRTFTALTSSQAASAVSSARPKLAWWQDEKKLTVIGQSVQLDSVSVIDMKATIAKFTPNTEHKGSKEITQEQQQTTLAQKLTTSQAAWKVSFGEACIATSGVSGFFKTLIWMFTGYRYPKSVGEAQLYTLLALNLRADQIRELVQHNIVPSNLTDVENFNDDAVTVKQDQVELKPEANKIYVKLIEQKESAHYVECQAVLGTEGSFKFILAKSQWDVIKGDTGRIKQECIKARNRAKFIKDAVKNNIGVHIANQQSKFYRTTFNAALNAVSVQANVTITEVLLAKEKTLATLDEHLSLFPDEEKADAAQVPPRLVSQNRELARLKEVANFLKSELHSKDPEILAKHELLKTKLKKFTDTQVEYSLNEEQLQQLLPFPVCAIGSQKEPAAISSGPLSSTFAVTTSLGRVSQGGETATSGTTIIRQQLSAVAQIKKQTSEYLFKVLREKNPDKILSGHAFTQDNFDINKLEEVAKELVEKKYDTDINRMRQTAAALMIYKKITAVKSEAETETQEAFHYIKSAASHAIMNPRATGLDDICFKNICGFLGDNQDIELLLKIKAYIIGLGDKPERGSQQFEQIYQTFQEKWHSRYAGYGMKEKAFNDFINENLSHVKDISFYKKRQIVALLYAANAIQTQDTNKIETALTEIANGLRNNPRFYQADKLEAYKKLVIDLLNSKKIAHPIASEQRSRNTNEQRSDNTNTSFSRPFRRSRLII